MSRPCAASLFRARNTASQPASTVTPIATCVPSWLAKHRKAAGIPTGTLHVLRHTAATLALTEGAMAAEAVAVAIVDKALTKPGAREPQPAL